MASYSFTTIWHIQAPLENVWDTIFAIDHWPVWWKSVKEAHVIKKVTENEGAGSIVSVSWRGSIPYTLTFTTEVTEVEPQRRLKGKARGDLEGWGTWSFSFDGIVTTVRYDWDVRTTKSWMNLIAPIARPVFRWSHNQVMHKGEVGLRRFLGSRPADHPKAEEQQNDS